MNIFIKNLKFKSIIMCIISFLAFFVLLGSSVNAAVPKVVNTIPNQKAYNGQMFNMSFDTYYTFNDADGDSLSVDVKQVDGSALPIWLTSSEIDISPSIVGTYLLGHVRKAAVVGDYAYVASSIDSSAGLLIFDISIPSNPNLVGTYDTPGLAVGVAVVGDYAYVADHSAGLQIIDISTPSNPILIGTCNTPGYAWKVAVVGNYTYVTDDMSGLQIIDVSTPSSPNLVGTCDTPGKALRIAVVSNYAYVADQETGLQIIDVSTPSSPSIVGSYDTPGNAYGVTVVGNYAYVAYSSGLQVIDISTPSSPSLVGTYNMPNAAFDVAVVGNYTYVAAGGDSGLQIIDVSTPSSPSLVGVCNMPPGAAARGVAVVGDYIYVADYGSGLQIVRDSSEGIRLTGIPSFSDIGTLNLKVTASDGVDEAPTTFSIDIQNTPTISEIQKNGFQNNAVEFSKEDFIEAFSDADGDELSKIQITNLPNYGELKLSGVAVSLNQEINVEDVDDLSFVPQKDWAGTTTFEWRGFDGTTYSDEGIVNIDIGKSWFEAWEPYIVSAGTAAVVIPFTIISAVLVKKAQKNKCCFKEKQRTIELNDKGQLVAKEEV